MLIFLYGPDTYRSREKLNKIIKRYRSIHKSGLALTRATQENFDFDRFKQILKTVSMFNEKKLIVLEDLLESFKEKKNVLSQLKNTKDSVIVFWEQVPDKRSNLFKWLKDNAQCQEFKLLGREAIRQWIENRCRSRNTKLARDARELLVLYIGSDLWRMSQEIEKLMSFKKGKLIEARDVELLVSPLIDLNIFETIEALAGGAKAKASELIWEHLSNGSDPLYLFSMILWQFRNLVRVKSCAKDTGLHPFVVKKSTYLTRRFTGEKLKNIYEYLLDIDLAIKTGRIEPRVALDLLVMEI